MSAASIPPSAVLLESVDSTMLLWLRDDRQIIGVLRSFDKFGNLVFESTRERFCADGMYADEPLGVFIVRGENIALVGELDSLEVPGCELVELETVKSLVQARREERTHREERRAAALKRQGLEVPVSEFGFGPFEK